MMKKTTAFLLILSILTVCLWTGCAGVPAPKEVPEEVPAAESTGWTISLSGIRSDSIDQAFFEDARQHESHYVERNYERKGETHAYKGMPLRMLCAIVDGPDNKHPYSFDTDLWKAGYDVTIVAADGYSSTFNTADIDPEAILIIDSIDGEAIAPMTGGDVAGNLWVRDVVSIELALTTGNEAEKFALEFDINGELSSYTLSELEASPFFIEDMGSYTTSAGTTYTNLYSGIKFPDFLSSYVKIEDDTTITVQATDGYEMIYNGAQIMDTSDGGIWILAFKADGDYLPLDPGYVRSVKVGPDTPNIPGHSSARMIKKIIVSAEPYRDFSLMMEGKISAVLDRQTVQTGISCHETAVNFYDRKNDVVIPYEGIPLWCLLAWSDDPDYAPHKQDSSILSYNAAAAEAGYKVVVTAGDGFTITLDSRDLHKNNQVILAMYSDGKELTDPDWPLKLVWDKDAEVVPAGIKAVRNVAKISLVFD